jgi:hypothetical protein
MAVVETNLLESKGMTVEMDSLVDDTNSDGNDKCLLDCVFPSLALAAGIDFEEGVVETGMKEVDTATSR